MKKTIRKYLLASFALILSLSFVALPQISKAASATSTATVYKVVSGDTLWKIAGKFKVSIGTLIAANPQLANPNYIYPTQKINIPQSGQPAAPQNNVNLSWETQVINLVNVERKKAGLQPLKADAALTKVARAKSVDMRDNNYFSHQSPTYGSPFEMMKQFGVSYGYAGENIAAGQTSPQAVVTAWMNSEGHRANILNKNYTKIGVGLAKGGSYKYYWTQHFTG